MIYFAHSEEIGLIKIGYSIRVAIRMKEISRDIGSPVRLLGVMEGDGDTEQSLHSRFGEFRTRHHFYEEWFTPSPCLIEFIEQHAGELVEESIVPKRMGRPTLPEAAKSSDRFGFRASPLWKDWLSRFAAFVRRDKADLVAESLEAYAKTKGFEQPPKR